MKWSTAPLERLWLDVFASIVISRNYPRRSKSADSNVRSLDPTEVSWARVPLQSGFFFFSRACRKMAGDPSCFRLLFHRRLLEAAEQTGTTAQEFQLGVVLCVTKPDPLAFSECNFACLYRRVRRREEGSRMWAEPNWTRQQCRPSVVGSGSSRAKSRFQYPWRHSSPWATVRVAW